MSPRASKNSPAIARRKVSPRPSGSRRAQDITKAPQLLPPERLKDLYATMLQCRLVKERVRELFQQGKLQENFRSRAGQEASEVGAMTGLEAGDYIAPRRHDLITGFGVGFGIMKSGHLRHVFARVLRPSNNNRASSGAAADMPHILAGEGSMVARLNMATGVAMACKAYKKPNIVLAFSGDDSTALASWHEAVDLAVSQKLPVVHVVQHDAWTEAPDPRLLMTVMEAEQPPRESGIPTLIVDGRDVVAVHRVVQEAVRRARQGHGPSLIECTTQRWPDPPSTSAPRSPATGDMNSVDPLEAMEIYLTQKGLWSDTWKDRLVKAITRQLDAAEAFAGRVAAKTTS